MLKTAPKTDDGYVFSAAEVKRNVGPRIVLPEDGQGVKPPAGDAPASAEPPE